MHARCIIYFVKKHYTDDLTVFILYQGAIKTSICAMPSMTGKLKSHVICAAALFLFGNDVGVQRSLVPYWSYNVGDPNNKIMRPTWGPAGAGRTHLGPMLATWNLLSGEAYINFQLKLRYFTAWHIWNRVLFIFIYVLVLSSHQYRFW